VMWLPGSSKCVMWLPGPGIRPAFIYISNRRSGVPSEVKRFLRIPLGVWTILLKNNNGRLGSSGVVLFRSGKLRACTQSSRGGY